MLHAVSERVLGGELAAVVRRAVDPVASRRVVRRTDGREPELDVAQDIQVDDSALAVDHFAIIAVAARLTARGDGTADHQYLLPAVK